MSAAEVLVGTESGSVRHRCAVVGHPIEHSLSPVLHRAGYLASGLDSFSYERIDCSAADLPAMVGSLPSSWRGLSVTMPAKAAAALVADRRSARVQRLGVANTLTREADGAWAAENTDVDGVLGSLAAHRVPVGGLVLLLGGGGTALAVVAALAERGVDELVIAGRRPQSSTGALTLADELGVTARWIPFQHGAIVAVAADLVVSTVPMGAADPLAAAVAGAPALLDVVYHPWPTALVAAGSPGRIVVTGLDMLLHQAVRQFELFTSHVAPIRAMRDALLAAAPDGPPLPLRQPGPSEPDAR